MEIQKMKREILRDEMTGVIEQALWRGDLKPGDRINETEIAQKAGISRGPIREAIRQLVGEGILVSKPHIGTFVAEWSDREIAEIYSLRAVLEGFASSLATQQAQPEDLAVLQGIVDRMRACAEHQDTESLAQLDFQFHDKLYALSGHQLLIERLASISRRIKLFLVMDLKVSPIYCARVADNHQAILDAIRSGDPKYAESKVREHILQVGENLLASLRKQRATDQDGKRWQPYELLV